MCVVQLLVRGLHVQQLVDAVRISTDSVTSDTLFTGQERRSLGKRWHVGKFTHTMRLGASWKSLHGALRCRQSFRFVRFWFEIGLKL